MLLEDEYPVHNIKMKYCTETYIEEFGEKYNKEYSLKPKLIVIVWQGLYMIFALYMYNSAKKTVHVHGIPKRRVNLMDMKQQTIFQVKIRQKGPEQNKTVSSNESK